MPKPLGNFTWVHQSWGWQLHSSLDLGSVVPMLLTDKSKAFPLPCLSPRVVACPPPGKVCVWAKWADKESAVCHKSKGPRLTWSCQAGFGCRGDLAEDRELSVVPATEATNWEKKSKFFLVKNILNLHLGLCGNPPEVLRKPALTHFVCWSRVSSLRKNKATLASSCFLLCPWQFHFPKIKEKKLKTQTAPCFWTFCSSRKKQNETTP